MHTHHNHHSHHSQAHWHQYFGLYDQKGNVPLPLKKIAVNAKINDYIAEVTYTQTYCNPSDIRLETEYFFPIANTACFHKFQAKFGTTTLEGVVKKKEEARQEYNRHNQEGHTVAYAEVTDDNYSVLCVKIGNIPPSSEIEIVFSYIERLEISLNKFWRFTLYSCLVEKSQHEIFQSSYNPALESAKNHSLVDYPYVKDGMKAKKGPQWEVNIEVNSRSPITFIKSPSHEVDITESQLSNIFSAKVSLFKLKAYTPNRDFVLLYATDAIHKPSYLLSPFEEGYCTLINFFPEISYMSFDDAYMASLDGKDPLEKMIESAKNEFVFIIDKSNTLDRESATLLLEALRFFLESLPSDSYCTVLIIGDQEAPDQSVRTTPEASASFLGKVRNAMPTSGKSRIVEAFETVGKMDIIPGYFRLVFLLTDGQLDTTASEVTQTIREKLFKTRVFVLGIGDASITDFTKKTALEGYGTCEVVREAGEIAEKVTYLLKTSIAPYFTDFELKIENESLFSYVVPLPKVIGCISPNELVEFFVVFNKKLDTAKKTTFSLKFYNGFNQRVEQFKQDIDVECADLSEAVVKLGMLKFCESLVKKKEIYEAMGDGEIVKSFKEDVQKSLVNTSIRHGILTSETAFVCLVKEGDDITRQIPSEKITMPSRLGQEYRDSDEEVVNVVSFYRQRTIIHHTNTQSPSHIYNLEHEMKPDVVVFSDAVVPEERNIEHLEKSEEHLEYQAVSRVQRVIEERLSPMRVVDALVIESLEKLDESSDSSVRRLEKVDTIPKAPKSPKLSKTNKESLLEKISKTAGSKRSPKKTDSRTGVTKNSLANNTKTAKTMTPGRSSGPKLNISPPVSAISSNKKISSAGRASSPAKFANKTYYVKPANNNAFDLKNKLNKTTPQKPKIEVVNSRNNEGKSISITGLKNILSPKSGKDLSKSQSVSSISNAESKRMITPAEKRKAIELDTISKTSQYLVGLQKDKGYWEPQVVIGNLLRYNLAALMKKIPKELQALEDREKVWVTILILTWIQYYGLNKDKWEDASKKAMSWLEENGKTYDLYSNSAKLAFGF